MSKVDAILEKFKSDPISTMYAEGTVIHLEEAKKQLYELLVGALPDESKSTCVCDRDACWNDYRLSMLTILKGLFQ